MSLTTWPLLIDVHVHLRDPGATYKEDFASGSRAALAGGFGFIIDMPNNVEPTLTMKKLQEKIKLASKKAACGIGFHFGTNGKNIKEFVQAAAHPQVYGLKLYCNHTTGEMLIEDIELLTKVFEAWPKGKPILVHAEGVQLSAVIALAYLYDQKLHVCHISQEVEVALVRQAKKRGLAISAGVTPHHLFMTSKETATLGGYAMMKPPLGTAVDQKALWQGLADGAIDLIESDHAPHSREEKERAIPAYGVPGLETTLGLMLLAVKQKKCSLTQVKQWLYDNPKKIFSINAAPNETITFDATKSWVVDESDLQTKCGWSPFAGWRLYGKLMKGKTA